MLENRYCGDILLLAFWSCYGDARRFVRLKWMPQRQRTSTHVPKYLPRGKPLLRRAISFIVLHTLHFRHAKRCCLHIAAPVSSIDHSLSAYSEYALPSTSNKRATNATSFLFVTLRFAIPPPAVGGVWLQSLTIVSMTTLFLEQLLGCSPVIFLH